MVNRYIQFLQEHKGQGIPKDQLLAKYHQMYPNGNRNAPRKYSTVSYGCNRFSSSKEDCLQNNKHCSWRTGKKVTAKGVRKSICAEKRTNRFE